MPSLFRQIIPAQEILDTLGKPDQFISWLAKCHLDCEPNKLFEGYQFAVTVCINSIIDGFCNDSHLGLESDFLFERCLTELIPLHQINSSCEKASLLRRIKPAVKAVAKSNSYQDLEDAVIKLNSLLLQKIHQLKTEHIVLSDDVSVSKELALNWLQMDFLHTFLHQIKGNGPIANWWNPISADYVDKSRLTRFLKGYTYALQFCWYSLLGEEVYSQTHLTQLHLANSWREYIYTEDANSEDVKSNFDRSFNLEEQSCFDSFFYYIMEELCRPIEEKFNIAVYNIHRYFKIDQNKYNKEQLFKDFFGQQLVPSRSAMTKEEHFRECMYWYPLTAITDGTTMTEYGPASFNTLLAGTVALYNKEESALPNVVVAKFTHPHPKKKGEHNYSFGVLIDGGSAAADHSYGWIIYHNLCWDHSGFANFQYETTMGLIDRFQDEGKIDLREMRISLSELEVLIGQEMLQQAQVNLHDQIKLLTTRLKDSNSFLLEVVTAYLCSKIFPDYNVQLNTDKRSVNGEIDVKIESNGVLILIECKLNPNSYSIQEVINKLSRKLAASGKPAQRKSMQFWFWKSPSQERVKLLEESGVVYHVLSDEKWEFSRFVPLKTLKQLLNNEI